MKNENSVRSLREIKFSLAQSILLPGDSVVHEQVSHHPEHHFHHADNADTSEQAQCATCNDYLTEVLFFNVLSIHQKMTFCQRM